MNIYIMDSMYFDSVEKLLPAEFAKGYKILLFYEKGRKLPDIVFEYISKGWIILRMLPKKMADCISLITFEIGVQHSVNPKDKFILWGTLPSPVFLRIFFYMMTLLPPIWVSVISSGIRQR